MSETRGVTGIERATVRHADGTVALRDATLLAEPGELLAVLGPSGSGKSTLLRAIAGLTPLNSGTVRIGGEVITNDRLRDVSMVFEDTALIPFLDVARNLAFGLELHRTPKVEARKRVAEQARGLRIGKLLLNKPQTLSRGEQSRVGIGRALVRAPKAFLLDEPLANLDAGERGRVRGYIREAVKDAGITTLYVTHDQAEAMAVGDRIAVLRAGAVVQLAPPRELYDRPADVFVAEVVSSTPLAVLPAQVVVSGGLGGYRIGAHVLPTWQPLPDALAARVGSQILLGVRAEDVHEEPAPEHGTVSGVVSAIEMLGPCAHVRVDFGEHRLTGRFGRRSTARLGDQVTVGIDAARAHVFDPVTGRALAHPVTD